MSSPAIVSSFAFRKGKKSNKIFSENFSNMTDYINNEEKLHKPEFLEMIDYQNNSQKNQYGLFNYKDLLSPEEIQNVKLQFLDSELKGSNLWNGAISFDNNFLKDNHILSKDENYFDINRMKNYVQKGFNSFLKETDLINENIEWVGGFHFNTEHIHCHVSFVEKNPSDWENIKRPINDKSFEVFKSSVLNSILQDKNKKFYKDITDIRNTATDRIKTSKKENNFINLIKSLPNDPNLQLNKKNMMKHKNKVVSFVENLINNDDELNKLVEKYDEKNLNHDIFLKKYYGERKNKNNHNDYSKNKHNELIERMSNSLLTEVNKIRKDNPLLFMKHNNKGIKKFDNDIIIKNEVSINKKNIIKKNIISKYKYNNKVKKHLSNYLYNNKTKIQDLLYQYKNSIDNSIEIK